MLKIKENSTIRENPMLTANAGLSHFVGVFTKTAVDKQNTTIASITTITLSNHNEPTNWRKYGCIIEAAYQKDQHLPHVYFAGALFANTEQDAIMHTLEHIGFDSSPFLEKLEESTIYDRLLHEHILHAICEYAGLDTDEYYIATSDVNLI